MKETTSAKDKKSHSGSNVSQHEAAALKVMMQFFADETLPFLGISGKVVSIAPTESIYLELKKQYEDFNLITEDGTWKHFEFQSTNGGVEDLKRFRSYESVASYTYGVEITTYVLFSGKIRHPVTEFSEGINTYRIIPVIMTNIDADQLLQTLKDKADQGNPITKEELVQLSLTPLMGGNTTLKDRILTAFQITKEASEITPQEKQKIEAVIYTMADKFLDSVTLEEVEAAVKMTRLGQMLVNDGFHDGFNNGFNDGFSKGENKTKLDIARKLLNIMGVQEVAENTGLSIEAVQKIKDEGNEAC